MLMMDVTYLGHYGDDLTVVNAARVSFGKRKEVFDERDARLVAYLVGHKHMLPFRHPQVSFHFKAPVFVARQLVKHQVGMSWSEISRRYVTGYPEYFEPSSWRRAAENVKQGSSDEVVTALSHDGYGILKACKTPAEVAQIVYGVANRGYDQLLASGVAPEQARMVLPVAHYTEWHWTGSLLAWAHVWHERTAPGAQRETRDCVEKIGPKMQELFPVCWEALTRDVAN